MVLFLVAPGLATWIINSRSGCEQCLGVQALKLEIGTLTRKSNSQIGFKKLLISCFVMANNVLKIQS